MKNILLSMSEPNMNLKKKYKPENAISWNLNFDTHVVTFEVEDA